MSDDRELLADRLEEYYRGCGWRVERADDGTVRAAGPSGVMWIGLAVIPEDLQSDDFERRLVALSDERMPAGGERCPFELLPAAECADDVRALLGRLQLGDRVSVYSLAA